MEQAVHKVYFLAFYVFELYLVEPAMQMLLSYALNPNSASCSMQTRVLEKINSQLATNRTKYEKTESMVGVTTIKEISKV